MPFSTLPAPLRQALLARGYTEPTTVQAAVLQPDTAGRDLLVSAQTGSGKTVAYGLAFADAILGDAASMPAGKSPMVLVVAPTRELAIQVHGELAWLYEPASGRVVSCVGGMDPRREQRELAAGCHIVVGTPGRLRDHLERGQLNVASLRVMVLDEADEMLDMGFREELEFILDTTPAERRTLMFSATIPREIASLARRYQRDALRIDMVARNQPHADIEYRAIRMAPTEAEHTLVNVLRFFETRGSLVFCATREAVRRVHMRLVERGFAAVALSGELSQGERTHALQSLRDGRASVCIATDVAARGLDLPDLDLVIHADLPTNRETLLHRSGRTGRAGRKGLCLLLVPYSKRRRAEQLLTSAGINAAWAAPPTADAIRARDQERLAGDPILTEAPLDEDVALARLLLETRTPEQVATALIRLYRARLPSPEELLIDAAPAWSPGAATRPGADQRPDHRKEHGEMAWFRAAVGRRNNADPKWLVPLICRLGHVTKQEIGLIRIFDRETKFEIAAHVADRFATAAATAGKHDIQIVPSSASSAATPYRGKKN